MATTIPLIDFKHYGLHVENTETVSDEDLKQLGEEFHEVFRTIGFCYIKNHGIPQELIDKMLKISKEFFDLPVEAKSKFERPLNSDHGWIPTIRDRKDADQPGAAEVIKESFNCVPPVDGAWPDSDLPQMKKIFYEFIEVCKKMAFRILDVLSVGLKLEGRDFLRQCHQDIGNKNQTTVRSVRYPPLPTDGSILPGQTRCGEHCDYGTVTMLFQDDIGGLEVCNTTGKYIQATPVPGAICVNIGELMQRWTADKLKATKHRVLIPEAEAGVRNNQGRQLMAFFIHPDDDCVIKCLDGSDKYQPMTALDYLKWRFSQTDIWLHV
ncbi:hypothetical protein SNE40_020520 [Patella caerulea]|uniref:Fe2OG dioxygenase domain-containing protein n=1 Tax=Patella caerulea TaxID=87958 RepID=A0AAN8G7P0_PATCE